MSKKMLALVKERPEPGLWMREADVPEVGPDDVLIKIKRLRYAERTFTSTTGTNGRRRR